MYTQWFKLSGLPFRLRPEPESLFIGGDYGQAVLRLRALIDGGHELVMLTGEPGTGKSTVLHALTDAPKDRRVVRLWEPDVAPPQLLDILHEQLSLPSRHGIAADSIDLFAQHIAQEQERGHRLLIIVDDAHNMPAATLRQLVRLLSLQPPPILLLAGEPHLAELLEWRALEKPALALASVQLPRFEPQDTSAYVIGRLERAGAKADIIEAAALADIHAFSGGVPALINVLCDVAMNRAMVRLSRAVTLQDVRAGARGLHWISDTVPQLPRLVPAPDATSALLLVARKGQPIARFTLDSGQLLVGRTEDCDLRLDSSFISRHHCQIVTSGGQSIIEDLGSTNGIAVNGGRHRRGLRHTLSAGDEVRIGDYTLTYVGADSDDGPTAREHA
jgi:general secretion pathway protein A